MQESINRMPRDKGRGQEKSHQALRRIRKLSASFTTLWKSFQAPQIRAGSSTPIKLKSPNKRSSLYDPCSNTNFLKHFGDWIRGFHTEIVTLKFHQYKDYFVHIFLPHLSQEFLCLHVFPWGFHQGGGFVLLMESWLPFTWETERAITVESFILISMTSPQCSLQV